MIIIILGLTINRLYNAKKILYDLLKLGIIKIKIFLIKI